MAERKLPSKDKCKEFAYHVAEDYRTLYENSNIVYIWFSESQIEKLIDFCKGNPVQDDLWSLNERKEHF